jgi:hypothetical protein
VAFAFDLVGAVEPSAEHAISEVAAIAMTMATATGVRIRRMNRLLPCGQTTSKVGRIVCGENQCYNAAADQV